MVQNENNKAPFDSSFGTLTVQVSESENAVPIKGALVIVTKDNVGSQTLKGALITDDNGITPPLQLTAPSYEDALDPTETIPYDIYYVRISHPGYYTEEGHMVQIFGSSYSHLNINMIPLPEFPQKEVISY
ncbi:MAG: hypothetical protein IKL72_00570 [Firmicutes bacterium]|nr:hypothetical protein [Bacillota bacterium]